MNTEQNNNGTDFGFSSDTPVGCGQPCESCPLQEEFESECVAKEKSGSIPSDSTTDQGKKDSSGVVEHSVDNKSPETLEKEKPTFGDWCKASRPQFYIATLIPLALGFTLAGKDTGLWRWPMFILILFTCFLIHLATNLVNDVFDLYAGVDTQETIGGSGGLKEGRLTLRHYRYALIGLYGVAAFLAPFIIIPSGQPVLWLFAVFALFSSFFYTAPPIRYGYRALGEVMVFLNMGVVMVSGSYMALARTFELYTVGFGIVVGLMVAGILYFQSLPEIQTDGAAGKKTLAVRLGMDRAFFLFQIWWPVVWLLSLMLWLVGKAAWPALLSFLAFPFFCLANKALRATTPDTLLALDNKGFLIRRMYLAIGIALILGVIFR